MVMMDEHQISDERWTIISGRVWWYRKWHTLQFTWNDWHEKYKGSDHVACVEMKYMFQLEAYYDLDNLEHTLVD